MSRAAHGDTSPKIHLPINARGKPSQGGAWCWQQKTARRLIRERMNGDSKTVYVLSVYDALTEIASDESSETFRTAHPYLAEKAGCGVSQLKLVLTELEDAGLILIETPRIKGPCTFTLLAHRKSDSVSRAVTSASHGTASDSRNMANVSHKPKLGSMATVEECSEERLEEKPKKELAEIIEIWNRTGLTKCQKLTDKRRSHLECRLKNVFWRENWRQGLEIIATSFFCNGQNDRGWRADIDWFIRSDDAVVNALEGKYSAKKTTATRPASNPDSVWQGWMDDLIRAYNDGEPTNGNYFAKKFRKAMEYADKLKIADYLAEQLAGNPAAYTVFHTVLMATVPGEGNAP